MSVSERISMILTAFGYTPATLAKATGIPLNRAKKILDGTNKIKIGEITKICHLTNIEPDLLFFGVNAAQQPLE